MVSGTSVSTNSVSVPPGLYIATYQLYFLNDHVSQSSTITGVNTNLLYGTTILFNDQIVEQTVLSASTFSYRTYTGTFSFYSGSTLSYSLSYTVTYSGYRLLGGNSGGSLPNLKLVKVG